MKRKDYNSIPFKNSAIERMSGKFGKGPGDGLKSASTSSATSTGKGASGLLTNPWGNKPQPLVAVKTPTIDKTSLKTPTAKPSTNVSTTSDKTTASSTATNTVKDVRKQNKVEKAKARGKASIDRINKRSEMSTEDRMARREKRVENAGKFAKGALEVLGTTISTAEAYKALKSKDKEEN